MDRKYQSFNFLFLFLLIILPKVGIVDFPLLILFIYSYLLNFVKRRIVKININNFVCLFILSMLLILLLVITYFSMLLNMSVSISYTFRPIRLIIILFLLLSIAKFVSLEDVWKALVLVAVFNAIIIYIQMLNNNLFLNYGFNEELMVVYRKPGIFNGYPMAGLMEIFGILGALYLFVVNRFKFGITLMILVLLIPTLFITSRMALYEFIFVILPSLMVFNFISHKYYKFKLAKISISLLIIVFISLAVLFSLAPDINILSLIRDKAFAVFINYLNNGFLGDYSSKDLIENHYLFPNNIKTFLIGNSLQPFIDGVKSDVSFVRILFTQGVFALLVYLLLYLFLFYLILKTKKISFNEKYFVIVYFILIFIACFKGPYLFSRKIAEISFLFLILSFYGRKNEKINISY